MVMATAAQEDLDMPSCFGAFGAKAPGKPSSHGKVFPVSHKHSAFRLSSSVSAHDLRSLDMEEGTETARECSPRTPLDDCITNGESRTGAPNASTSLAPAAAPTASLVAAFHWKGFVRLWKMRRLSTFPPFGVTKLSKRFTRSSRESHTSSSLLNDAHGYCFKHSWRNFSLSEIRAATNNFSSDNIIGKGGYAQVYKGCLEDGRLVAIKRLMRGSMEQKIVDFLSELGIIVHINHPNAAKLVGYSVEGGMYLVLQLSPNGSLASRLHESKEKLEWNIRYKVALGTAKGLHYLHENCQRRIIHRDIKAANILLTEDFEPQICDFGLAKWLPDQWTHHNVSQFEGTFGYLAPEYFMHGIVDEKTDVFAYGVLLLELITGRRALDSAQHSLVMWAKPFLDSNDMKELVDPFLDAIHDAQQIQYVILAASLCVHHSPLLRPRMSQVVQILEGEANLESMKLSPRKMLHRTYSEQLIDTEDYNLSRYLNDIKRHKQVALES